jgi:hypothetical protein
VAATVNGLKWTIVTCVAAWLVVLAVADRGVAVGAGLGMLGPLVAAVATHVVLTRAARHRSALQAQQTLMIAFGVKMIAFAIYVVAVVRLLAIDPLVFGTGFAVAFVACHVAETVAFRRRIHAGLSASS